MAERTKKGGFGELVADTSRVAWDDAGETPNVHFVYYDTGIAPVIFSAVEPPVEDGRQGRTSLPGHPQRLPHPVRERVLRRGARRRLELPSLDGKRLEQFDGDGGEAHARNFIEALRKRDPKILNAPVEATHYSSSWCHLANIAYRLGAEYEQGRALEIARGFGPWAETLDGFRAHLEANGFDPTMNEFRVSSILDIDPARETFTGPGATAQALAVLSREYRKPYVVPAVV